MPRTIEGILRNNAVDTIKPGDKIILHGTLLVVPEASKLLKPGHKIFLEKQKTQERNDNNYITGLSDLGVQELS